MMPKGETCRKILKIFVIKFTNKMHLIVYLVIWLLEKMWIRFEILKYHVKWMKDVKLLK